MGSLAIVLMFIFLFGLIFIAPVLHAKDTLRKVEQFMLYLASNLSLEFHKKPLAKKDQKIGYPDVSGEINQRAVHVYVEDTSITKEEKHQIYVEVPCHNLLHHAFKIYKRDMFTEILRPAYDHSDAYEQEDFVMEKYALESEEYGFFAHFLNDDVCDTLVDAQELVQGIFELNHGMLTYKEPTNTFGEDKADRIEKIVKVSIQIAERVDAMD
ncbi:hypothetical protein [Microscilla marina]|uniref:Uncharacterized protein n=1 Tax=Microscilla marina ATCC 23134 TaxID=313606 RepID=A1ZC41_MICM2|nr:hypothetical protein [Microscilla marina]EAY31843.1 hypothetical protein M23134_01872 [Microscilla marina ATCC 23134]